MAGLALLGLPTFLVSMDLSVLYLAVPHRIADLAPSGIQRLWTVDIYGFPIAGFLVSMGTVDGRGGGDAVGESFDRAVAAAGQVPTALSDALLAAARDAFTSGLHVVALVSAVVYAGLAAITLRAFRHATTNTDQTSG